MLQEIKTNIIYEYYVLPINTWHIHILYISGEIRVLMVMTGNVLYTSLRVRSISYEPARLKPPDRCSMLLLATPLHLVS